jgi:tRNA nucleotidyltransferase (CCA-adding enzyme)
MSAAITLGRLDFPEEIGEIAGRLEQAGYETWYVGGALRDRLLGFPSGDDVDLATAADPETVQKLFRRTVAVGVKFGTVGVLDRKRVLHEVTTFRRDVATDGRRAVVEYGASLDEDLARRDFTINALAADLAAGRIEDPFGGRADLHRRLIRCVGAPQERFSEDGLRPLRAIRFSAVLDFRLEPSTAAALAPSVATLRQVARERQRDELIKMLAEARRLGYAFEQMRQSGILEAVAPELSRAPSASWEGLERLPRFEPWLRLAAWAVAAELDEPRSLALFDGLRLPRREQRLMAAEIVAAADLFSSGVPRPGAEMRRWLARFGVESAVGAARIAQALDPARQGLLPRVRRTIARHPPLHLADLDVDGAALLELGLSGKCIGSVLRQLLAEVIDDPRRNSRAWLLARAHTLSTGESC